MRKALIVGVDHYDHVRRLNGAVRDAQSVRDVLERHADGKLNFRTPQLLTSTSPEEVVDRRTLRAAVRELFEGKSDVALFYFAGHGDIDETGGFLCPSDHKPGDDGLSLGDVMTWANNSEAQNKIIILDSCHSGAIGGRPDENQFAQISDGVTILTASTPAQVARERADGAGVFTTLLVDALSGAAANLVGAITPGSVYAHIDQSLGEWAQRPVFKTNVERFVSLRTVNAPIPLESLRQLTSLFVDPAEPLPLNPTYERDRSGTTDPSMPPPDPRRTQEFEVLQDLVKVNLVRPVDEKHMYWAAMHSTACQLTVLGQHYWNLVDEGLI